MKKEKRLSYIVMSVLVFVFVCVAAFFADGTVHILPSLGIAAIAVAMRMLIEKSNEKNKW